MGSNAIKTIINCGTTQVSVSIFSERNGSLVLEKSAVENLIYDYTASEEWESAVSNALSTIVSGLKPKGEIVVIAPGQLLLTKNVKVPKVTAERQRQVISFEAQSSFPFPLDELVWDGQVISDDGLEQEVVLFALKRTNAVRFTSLLIEAGITPTAIHPATNLDIQAYRYCTRFEENLQAPALIVNVGAHTTNLTFVMDETNFSINNISIGGNFLTQKLAESTGLPFQSAEQKKIAYFSGELKLAQSDPLGNTFAESAEAFIRRLSQEITRRIVNFKRATKGAGPVKIILAGRGAMLPGFAEKLAELQRVPVESLNLAENITIEAPFTAIEDIAQEVVGEAAALTLQSPSTLNLIPAEIASEFELKKKTPFLLAAGLLLAIAPWPAWLYIGQEGKELKKEFTTQTAEIKKLKDREASIENLQEKAEKVQNYINTLDSILESRYFWDNFLAKLQEGLKSLQKPTGVDEDDIPTFRDDRHVWIDKLEVEYEKPKANGIEQPKANAKITFKMLIPSVNGITPQHDANAFLKRRDALEKALMDTGIFEKKLGDRLDTKAPNVPALTITLRLK